MQNSPRKWQTCPEKGWPGEIWGQEVLFLYEWQFLGLFFAQVTGLSGDSFTGWGGNVFESVTLPDTVFRKYVEMYAANQTLWQTGFVSNIISPLTPLPANSAFRGSTWLFTIELFYFGRHIPCVISHIPGTLLCPRRGSGG